VCGDGRFGNSPKFPSSLLRRSSVFRKRCQSWSRCGEQNVDCSLALLGPCEIILEVAESIHDRFPPSDSMFNRSSATTLLVPVTRCWRCLGGSRWLCPWEHALDLPQRFHCDTQWRPRLLTFSSGQRPGNKPESLSLTGLPSNWSRITARRQDRSEPGAIAHLTVSGISDATSIKLERDRRAWQAGAAGVLATQARPPRNPERPR